MGGRMSDRLTKIIDEIIDDILPMDVRVGVKVVFHPNELSEKLDEYKTVMVGDISEGSDCWHRDGQDYSTEHNVEVVLDEDGNPKASGWLEITRTW